MNNLYEESDSLNAPIECFYYDASKENFPVLPHWHYFMEILFLIKGHATIHTNTETYYLSEGDMILFHPKTIHSIYATDDVPLCYAGMKFDINRLNRTPVYAPKIRSIFRCAEKNGMNIFFPSDQLRGMEVSKLFLRCIDEMKTQQYGFDLIVRSEIYSLLIKLIRCWQDQGFCVDTKTFAEDSLYDIYNITEFIDAHMNDGLLVSQIAEECGMSYSYFAKKFLAVYGKTCKKYMEEVRIFKVEEFLMFTDFDLNYISQETGFSDCSHMIKSFQAYRGCTPKQFRKEHKQKKGM